MSEDQIDRMDEKTIQCLEAVEDHYSADVYLFNGDIDYECYGKFITEFSGTLSAKNYPTGSKKQKNALLILVTYGGLTSVAYNIACLFQNYYENLYICVPNICASAGTLIALGANKLIMTTFSQLGPLDAQIEKGFPGIRESGLRYKNAFESLMPEILNMFYSSMEGIVNRSNGVISIQEASKIAVELTVRNTSQIFQKLDPYEISKDYRSLRIALDYGERLKNISGNPKKGTVRNLVEKYPSHGFVINEREAKELFEIVESPSKELYNLLRLIQPSGWIDVNEGTIQNNAQRNLHIYSLSHQSRVQNKGENNNG